MRCLTIATLVLAITLPCVIAPPAAAQTTAQRPHPEHVVQLPPRLELQPPAANIPPEIARFHGAFAGTWGDEMRHILVVERVEASGSAAVVYAYADFPPFAAFGTWFRETGAIRDGRLVLTIGGATATYAMPDNGQLAASFARPNGQVTAGHLARIDPATLKGAVHVLSQPPIAGERVLIPHLAARRADGMPIRLEARLYRQKGTAPAPLALINHGSDIGRNLLLSYGSLGEARWLLDHGYAVLVPMRRGRGGSEGVYGEHVYARAHSGQVTDVSTSVEQAVEDLESAITWARTQPFVKAGPILLAGQSRGGFLAIVYAGHKPAEVAGVINFVGGWMGGGPENERLNTPYFAEAGRGAGAKVPQLWLYAERDSFYGEAHIRSNHKAFTEAGGTAQLEFYKGLPGDGHFLRNYPDRWRATADAFLARLKAQ